MKVLHLSDTTLSGSPIRIVDLLNKHADGVQARHIVWHPTFGYRTFKTDLVSSQMSRDEVASWLEWADVLHFHNRHARQELFQRHRLEVPKKPAVIQMHSPKKSEDFTPEIQSGLPLAIIAQYHVRQWPELRFVVPNVVDISSEPYVSRVEPALRARPVVSYAPSNVNAKGWDDKGYGVVSPLLKKLKFAHRLDYQLIVSQPHHEVLRLKALADVGIDEVVTGSYHLSSLEYMAFGIPCIAYLDELTEKVVKDLTGADTLPWLQTTRTTFKQRIHELILRRNWQEFGRETRRWMETHWSPEKLAGHYLRMYGELK